MTRKDQVVEVLLCVSFLVAILLQSGKPELLASFSLQDFKSLFSFCGVVGAHRKNSLLRSLEVASLITRLTNVTGSRREKWSMWSMLQALSLGAQVQGQTLDSGHCN